MSSLSVAPIVEGYGEVVAVRRLLERVWTELLKNDYIEIIKPIRQPRHKLLRRVHGLLTPDSENLEKAVRFARHKLNQSTQATARTLILMLLDSDEDCPAEASAKIKKTIAESTGVETTTVILAKIEYESWFVATCHSLSQYLDCSDVRGADDPEGNRMGKAWIQDRFKGGKYSETVDQVRLTAAMDLAACRARCPSFDKLCRELESAVRRR